MMFSNGRRNTVALEIAWRWFFLVFTIVVVAGVAIVAQDAVRLRPNEGAAFRSRNLFWMAAAALSLFRRYQPVMESSLLVVVVTGGGFWVLAGAAVRAALYARQFLALLILRTVSLVAGAAALFSCLAVILAVTRWRQPLGLSAALVSAFSMLVYFCWRWISLLLAVLESAPSLVLGWETFASQLPRLAVAAAINSTLKWLALAAATLPLAALVAALPIRYWSVELLAAGVWLVALTLISGYFGARLRDQIAVAATPHPVRGELLIS